MNTVARTVEYERIHLYLHLTYVKRPAINAKNEYHSLVSPMVRKGGLSRVSHMPIMNEARTATAAPVKEIAIVRRRLYRTDDTDQWSFAHIETTAPQADSATESNPKNMKLSQVMIPEQFNRLPVSFFQGPEGIEGRHRQAS